jgi:GNAT superfamily N-acetyltransferase
MAIEYRSATQVDIPLMTEMRIAFLQDILGPADDNEVSELRSALNVYHTTALANNDYLSEIAWDGDIAVGIGGIVIREQPGGFKNPSGRLAYVMNMYTIPAYRRKGISTIILRRLMDRAKEIGITAFELLATKEGAPVYEKLGYYQHTEPVYRKME